MNYDSQLLTEVYEQLRRVAARKMAALPPGQTLQPTAVVHEAWLRLQQSEQARWANQAHFVGAAAEAMRQILVEQARRKHSLKRGGGRVREELHESRMASPEPPEVTLAVDEALHELAERDPVAAELVKLRFFGGLTQKEAAVTLDLAPRTADRLWAYARAWLRRRVKGDPQI